MIITLSGDPGSGKSSVAKAVAKELGLKHYSGGDMRGAMATQRGMTIDEYNKLGEHDPSTDKDIDDRITDLGRKEDGFIIDSRLAWHFIPSSIKIYLACDVKVAAQRIHKETSTSHKKRPDEPAYKDAADVLAHITARIASDKKRYRQHYNLDHTDKKHYDLVVDTTHKTLRQVIDAVLAFVKARR